MYDRVRHIMSLITKLNSQSYLHSALMASSIQNVCTDWRERVKSNVDTSRQ